MVALAAPAGGEPAAGVAPQDAPAPAEPEEPVDPDEAKRAELMEKPDFAKLVKLMKMKVPLQSILNQVRAAGIYTDDEVLLFVTPGDISKLKASGGY